MAASAAFTFDGAAGSLLKYSALAAGPIVANLDSLDGVSNVTWAIISTDETSAPADYTLALSSAKNSRCSTTALGAGTAAILRCTVNGGVGPTGESDAAFVKTAKFYVPTTNALEVGATDETFESDTTYGSTGVVNGAIRAVAALAASQDAKASVRLSTTAAHALSGLAAVDGVVPVAGDRVLVPFQGGGGGPPDATNGIYVAAAAAWSRAADANDNAEVTPGLHVYVEEGTLYGERQWIMTTTGAIVVGTTAIQFERDTSISDREDLVAATAAATADQLCRRDGSAKASFGSVNVGLAAVALGDVGLAGTGRISVWADGAAKVGLVQGDVPTEVAWNVTTLQVGAYPAAIGELVQCDPSGGAFAVTLPATSAANAGKLIAVKVDVDNDNAVNVTPNGVETIDGVAGVLALASGRQVLVLQSRGGAVGWRVVGRTTRALATATGNTVALRSATATCAFSGISSPYVDDAGGAALQIGGVTAVQATATGATTTGVHHASTALSASTTPATAGEVRIPDGGTVQFRDAAGAANRTALSATGSTATVGGGYVTLVIGATTITTWSVDLATGGRTRLRANGTELGSGYAAEVTTADGVTWTTALTFPVTDETTAQLTAEVCGDDDASSDSVAYRRSAVVGRTGAGAPTVLQDTVLGSYEHANLAAADHRWSVVGNDVAYQVLGKAATNITWRATGSKTGKG